MRILGVHADTMPQKRWPRLRFIRLLDMFLDRHPDFLALVLGVDDLRLDRGRLGERVVPCCGLPLGTSLALVSMTDFFLGVDSSLLHAADFYRVPSVGLYATRQHASRWGLRFTDRCHVVARGPMSLLGEDLVLEGLEHLVDS
jgi:ADP-heptose:LPS heptosyltransferase